MAKYPNVIDVINGGPQSQHKNVYRLLSSQGVEHAIVQSLVLDLRL